MVSASHTLQMPSQQPRDQGLGGLWVQQLGQHGRGLAVWGYARNPWPGSWSIWPVLGSKEASGRCKHQSRGSDE